MRGRVHEPWEEHPHIWKTKSAFFTWMRGNLRRALWEKYPPKIEFKNSQCTKPPEDYVGRAKTGTECALTGEWIAKSYLEVDHLKGNVSLTGWDDVLPFIQHLCTHQGNMQLVSKHAHKIKSYAEKQGISFEEAQIEKEVILIMKEKRDKQWLKDNGVIPASNAKARRQQVREKMSELEK